MNKHQKFLEFNGKTITFLSIAGEYWVAIKPICEALGVDYIRQFKNLKDHKILGQLLSEQTMVAADEKMRKMACLPEKYIYGWIFSLNSQNPELMDYQKTCYDILYNHFHGTITNRKELLLERNKVESEIYEMKQTLKDENEKYKALRELENRKKTLSTQLNSIDKELIKQPELFEE